MPSYSLTLTFVIAIVTLSTPEEGLEVVAHIVPGACQLVLILSFDVASSGVTSETTSTSHRRMGLSAYPKLEQGAPNAKVAKVESGWTTDHSNALIRNSL